MGALRNVTLPMMSPVMFYTLVLAAVEVLQYFLVPLVLKNGTGEPGGSTLFYNLYLYKTFFTFQDMAYGATLAWLLFAITLAAHAAPVPERAALGLLRGRGALTPAAGMGLQDPEGGRPASGGAGAARRRPARPTGRVVPSHAHRRPVLAAFLSPLLRSATFA